MIQSSLIISLIASMMLMGCQIEITPLDSSQSPVDTETDTYTEEVKSDGVRATSVTLYWSQPTTTQGNKTLRFEDIIGYKVRYRLNDETLYRDLKFVTNATQTQLNVDNLDEDSLYYFEVAAVNQLGMVGQYQPAVNGSSNN